MRSFRRAGVALAALATLGSAQTITARVGDSVFVGFFVLDQSPHVFRGGATFTVCGSKKLYARFYSDARLTKLLTNDSVAVMVACVATDTTKAQPLALDTTRTPPSLTFNYPGFPSCAGSVGDSSVHLPYCSPPAAPPLFYRVYGGPATISCRLNRWAGTQWLAVDSLCAPVTGCFTQDSIGHSFSCADTVGLFVRTNFFSPTIPP
jgi:hypothetical protein